MKARKARLNAGLDRIHARLCRRPHLHVHMHGLTRAMLWLAVAGAAHAAPALKAAPAAHPPNEPHHVHLVRRGDTVIGVSRQLLLNPVQWRELARLNGLRNANLIKPGASLWVPLRWMVSEGSPGVVQAVIGDVSLASAAAPAAVTAPVRASVGAAVPEGSQLATGSNGSVTVRLVDGTVLRLRADSRLQVDEARRIPAAAMLRSGVRLDEGRIEVQVTPPAEPAPRAATGGRPGFELRTPQGVLGVRGTEFRVATDGRSKDTRAEVLRGLVAVTGLATPTANPAATSTPGSTSAALSTPTAGTALLAAGFGTVVDSAGRVRQPVALLLAPDLGGFASLQERPLVRFDLPALPGVQSWRLEVARDANFDDVVVQQAFSGNALRVPDLPDGNYVLRLRGLDANGLQGRNADLAFTLKARPEPPLPSQPAPRAQVFGAVSFAWAANPEARVYRLQLARDVSFKTVTIDRADLSESRAVVDGLTPGTYHWRLASIRGERDQGPFGDVRSFELKPPPPAAPQVRPPEVGDDGVSLAWDALPGQTFDFELAREASFATPLLQQRLTQPRVQITPPGPGRYYLRLRAREADGFVGSFGTPQFFEVPNCLRAASGGCVRAAGDRVLLP